MVSGTVCLHGSVGLTGYLTVIVEGSSDSLLVTVGGIEIDRRRLRRSNTAEREFIGVATGPIHLGVRFGGPALIQSYGCGRSVAGLASFPQRHLVGERSRGRRVRLMSPVIFRPLADSVSDGLPTGQHPRIRVT